MGTAAIAEAAAYLRAGQASEARVKLFKRLAAWPCPLEDRQAAYLWLEGGEVYIQRCPKICFVGVPVFGGDYNAGQVLCRPESISAVRIAPAHTSRQ